MTKMIKMSLVAAVAVAGFTTTASAASLESAIKDVKISGYVQYRMNKTLDNGTGNADEAAADVEYRTTVNVPVNDQVSAKLVVADDADNAARLRLTEANFITKMGAATVVAGLQSIPTPFVDPTVSKGNGLVALIPAGSVTLAAGYFYNVSLSGGAVNLDNNLMAVGALGKAGSVSYQAWYASMDDTTENGTATDTVTGAADIQALSLIVNAKAGGVNIEAAYASKDGKVVNDKEQTQARLVASGKAGAVSYAAGVVVTGTDGGDVAIADTSDSAVDFGSAKINAGAAEGAATIFYAKVGTALNDNFGASVAVLSGADDNTVDDTLSDIEAKITYSLGKNFSTYARYNTTNVHGAEKDYLRLQAKYSF